MANEIRTEDFRRLVAEREDEAVGEGGIRRYVDPRSEFGGRAADPIYQPPMNQARGRTEQAPGLRVAPEERGTRGQYSRSSLHSEPDLRLDDDDDLGLPPSYSPTDYGREDSYYEDEPPRRSRLLPVSVALLALLGFAGVVWYAYDWGAAGGGSGQVPIIQPTAGEEKVKPVNEGGIEVPNQESTVLNPESDQPVAEVLMPQPEEPIAPPQPAAPEPVVVLTPSAPPAAPPAPTGNVEENQAVGTSIDELLTKLDLTSDTQSQGSSLQGSRPQGASEAGSPSEPTGAVELPAPEPAATPQIPAGSFLIQLASLTSAEAATDTWNRLQKKHSVLLGNMDLSIQKAEIEGKGTYYRVQTGPLPNKATADDLCAQLKAAQQDCIVVKR